MNHPSDWDDPSFRALLEAMPDGILIVNGDGQIVVANAQAARIFGYDTLAGASIEALLPLRQRSSHAAKRVAFQAFPHSRPMGTHLDIVGERRDGQIIPLDISLSPFARSATTFTIAAVRDISLQKRAEEVLREAEKRERLLHEVEIAQKNAEKARAEAESANRAKSLFLANMSHELRTPLNAILGFSDLLQERVGDALAPPDRRYLANVKEAGEHLLALINDLLDLARVEANKIELRLETVSLRDLLTPVVETGRLAAEQAGVRFGATYPPDECVSLDASRVREVLHNLVSNAVKFTTAPGEVEVVVRCADGDLLIEVRDTGVGIPADERDRVFGVFERLHQLDHVPGMGLGLALTKRLVELHGGEITFESAPGAGTVFRVRLPQVVHGITTGGRLLIVEDERRSAELVLAAAAEVGIPCEVVLTAERALGAIEGSPPLAIVLDLRLPGVRGEHILTTLNDGRRDRIPTLVMSIEDDNGTAQTLGADDHLTKPLDRRRLLEWLRQVVADGSR